MSRRLSPGFGGSSTQELLPGKAGRSSRQHALDGIGELVQGLRHAVEHAHLSSAEAQRKGLDQASKARVRRQDREARTCPLKLGQSWR